MTASFSGRYYRLAETRATDRPFLTTVLLTLFLSIGHSVLFERSSRVSQ